MTLINRFTRLFQADLHGLLDKLEEPGLVLKQAIREMEEEVQKDRQELNRLRVAVAKIDRRHEELESTRAKISNELELCIRSQKDDLAKSLVRKKLEAERLIQIISEKRIQHLEKISKQSEVIQQCEDQLESFKNKMEVLYDEASITCNSPSDEDNVFSPSFRVTDEEVEVALMKEKESRKLGGES